jgi:hypothetical protein
MPDTVNQLSHKPSIKKWGEEYPRPFSVYAAFSLRA